MNDKRAHVAIRMMAAAAVLMAVGPARGGALKAPPGLFKDVNDQIVGDAIIINGKQLFIDDHLIEELDGAERVLNQPVKHPGNPLVVKDRAWEDNGPGYSTVLYDADEAVYKLWYGVWTAEAKPSEQILCYATSTDGIRWEKPIINERDGTNVVFTPGITGFQSAGLFRDPVEKDPARRYKMLFSAAADGTSSTWSTNAAYSPDGIHWTAEPRNPIIPFSDTQICPFWDPQRGRYVAHIRFGPPNTRLASRIESEDFIHWSPKITLFRRSKLDEPFGTKHYAMQVMPYAGAYVGLLWAYHGETIQPIPEDKLWMDKTDLQLAHSRNGVVWTRVGRHGAIPHAQLSADRDWKAEAEQATFLPHGEHGKAWDWGSAAACYQPLLVVDDEIRIYYIGHTGRHWASYHGDEEPVNGLGLATLRLDGFVSVQSAGQGTLTTRPLVFIGDTLEVNANATGGSIQVEALDADGNVIEGFAREDCTPLTTDSVRHVVTWRDDPDCHLIQATPIKLRFHIVDARLYAFAPRIRHVHYVPSYD